MPQATGTEIERVDSYSHLRTITKIPQKFSKAPGHLYLKGRIFYYRFRFPKKFCDYPTREIRISLHTAYRCEAALRASKVHGFVLEELEKCPVKSKLSQMNNIAANRAMIEQSFNQIAETRQMIGDVQRMVAALTVVTHENFNILGKRINTLERSDNLQNWLLGLEYRGYDIKYRSLITRMIRITNDFYQQKGDNWTYNDIYLMSAALDKIGINPQMTISLKDFISTLIDELLMYDNQCDLFSTEINQHAPKKLKDYSQFVINNVSYSFFIALHLINDKFKDRLSIINTLNEYMNITEADAIKSIIYSDIRKINVNIDYKISHSDIANEILCAMRLEKRLTSPSTAIPVAAKKEHPKKIKFKILKNNQAENIFRSALTYLSKDSVSLVEKRLIFQNIIKGYSYFWTPPQIQKELVIPPIILALGKKFKIPLNKDNIELYAYHNGTAYVCLRSGLRLCIDNKSKTYALYNLSDYVFYDTHLINLPNTGKSQGTKNMKQFFAIQDRLINEKIKTAYYFE